MKNNWRQQLVLSAILTGTGTILACILLRQYNLLLTNQLTIAEKVLLSLLGTVSGIIAGVFNIKSINLLLKSRTVRAKYLKLVFLNFLMLIFQAFIFFAALIIVGYD